MKSELENCKLDFSIVPKIDDELFNWSLIEQ